jgi:HlyD family secretion protein
MSQAGKLFRQTALDRLASPDGLDALVRIVTLKSWLVVLPFALAAGAGLAWSVFGRIPIKVAGLGIIVNRSGIAEVVADSAGRVARLRVDVGDFVAAGAPLVDVARPDFDDRLRQLDARIASLQERRTSLAGFAERSALLAESALGQQRQLLSAQIRAAGDRRRGTAERLRVQRELLQDGLVTQSAVLATQQEVTAHELEIESLNAQLTQLDVRQLEFARTQDQERTNATIALEEATRERTSLLLSRDLAVQVTSPFRGRIIEVKVGAGTLLSPGMPVVALERSDLGPDAGAVEAIVYVPSAAGKRIAAGMAAEVMPATVKREEAGFIRGRVRFVSEYPVSLAAAQNRLQNDALVNLLAGGAQAPLEMRVVLEPAATPSGFAWSTRNGPPDPVLPGTLCRTEIVLERRRPITLFLPALQSRLK